MSAERLVDCLWESRRPASADVNLRSLIHQLRAVLGAGCITHDRPGGYALTIRPDQVDAEEFVSIVETGRTALAGGDASTASRQLHRALALWRGEPFADLAGEPALRVEIMRLNECRANALEHRFDADLALGLHRELISELTATAARFPFRERFHGQLMLALYRSGRQAEALQTYRAARAALIDDLGLTPGAELSALHEAMLRADPCLDLARAAPVVATSHAQVIDAVPTPALLPPDIRAFTGRADQLASLDAFLAEGHAGPVVISAIEGMAGVGKTALAVHWAHRARGHFPDGQLYLNLRGYAPTKPLDPIDALRRLLFALGVSPGEMPSDIDDAAGLYRSLLADKRAFVLLDNARDAEQVRPLLPGGRACLVVITSRDRLGGLVASEGARRVPLDVLNPTESVDLLTSVLGSRRSDLDRVVAGEVADLCGHLPLALRIAAANLADQPQESVTDYVTRLRTGSRLSGLQVDGDPQSAMRHTLDLSYQALSVPARRLLCLLALMPGDDFAANPAAALADLSTSRAQAQLDELTRRHLLHEHQPGRFRFHDLVRAYAGDLVAQQHDEADRAAAYDRLLGWYAASAAAADTLIRPSARTPPIHTLLPIGCVPQFASQTAAIDWFDSERDNLAATITASQGSPGNIWRQAMSMRGWLQRRAPRQTWIELYRLAIDAARKDTAVGAEATLLTGLAIAHSLRLETIPATEAYESAIALFDRIGDVVGTVDAIASLGGLLIETGDLDRGMARLRRAYDLVADIPDEPELRFKVEMNLGFAHRRSGDPARAMHHYRAAEATAELSAERAWLSASVLTNIGALLFRQGEYQEAAAVFQTILRLARETGDPTREASALDGLAEVEEALGNPGEAITLLSAAVGILQPFGDRYLPAMLARLDRLTSAEQSSVASPAGGTPTA